MWGTEQKINLFLDLEAKGSKRDQLHRRCDCSWDQKLNQTLQSMKAWSLLVPNTGVTTGWANDDR